MTIVTPLPEVVIDTNRIVPGGVPKPEPVDLEIVEYCRNQEELDRVNQIGIIRPNAVLVNGRRVQMPKHQSLTVERMEIDGDDLAKVTLTLFVRSAQIHATLAPTHEGTAS